MNLLPFEKYNRVANPTFSERFTWKIYLENITVQSSYTPRKAHKKNLISKRPWELQSSADIPEQDSLTYLPKHVAPRTEQHRDLSSLAIL